MFSKLSHSLCFLRFALVLYALFSLILLCSCSSSPSLTDGQASDPQIAQEYVAPEAKEYSPPHAKEYASASLDETTGDSSGSAEDGNLVVRYLDVGQGDATLIECSGHWMLIDGGKSEESSKIYAVLKSLGVEKLDAIVATHPDSDHIGGISGALNFCPCDALFCSTATSDTETFSDMVKYLSSKSGIGVSVPSVGLCFSLGGALVTFLGPVRSFDADNNNSLVLRIDFGSTSFLFTGDAEKEAEAALVSSGSNIDCDVLQVGHHGSASSSISAFLKAASPAYSVVSVGENDYGHPTQEALGRISAVGSQILRTDQLGDITFVSDGSSLIYSTSKG